MAAGADFDALLDWMRPFADGVVVAFSGGVDSALVAHAAHRALGGRATAMTADSPSLMRRELMEAAALARRIGIRHEIRTTDEATRAAYVANRGDRCFHCRDAMYEDAVRLAQSLGRGVVVDGINADDRGDHDQGLSAATRHGVRHPLLELGVSKASVRAMAKAEGLPVWDKPQLACLASRIPRGMAVTPARLARIEAVEEALYELGFRQVRARLVPPDDTVLRIEVGTDEVERLAASEYRAPVVARAKAQGFEFVTLDLEGFRSGSLNPLIQLGATRGKVSAP